MTDYYFSNAGDDAGAGTIGDPWEEPRNKEASLSTGDNFYFKKDDVYRGGGSFIPTNNGSWTIDSYGTGTDPPRFTTLFSVSGTWTSLSGDRYRIAHGLGSTPQRAWPDEYSDSYGRRTTTEGDVDGTDYGFFADGTNLTVYSESGDPGTVEVSTGDSDEPLDIRCKDWTIKNIWWDGGHSDAIVINQMPTGGTHAFEGNTHTRFGRPDHLHNNTTTGGVIADLDDAAHDGMTFTSCVFDRKANSQVGEQFTTGNSDGFRADEDDISIINCTMRGNNHSTIRIKSTTNNCLMRGCTTSSPYSSHGRPHGVKSSTNTTIMWCEFFDHGTKAHVGGTNALYYGNIYRDNHENTNTTNGDFAVDVDSNNTETFNGIDFFNNICARNYGPGFQCRAAQNTDITGMRVRNNILWKNAQQTDSSTSYLLHAQFINWAGTGGGGAAYVNCSVLNNVMYASNGQANVIDWDDGTAHSVTSIKTENTGGIDFAGPDNLNNNPPFSDATGNNFNIPDTYTTSGIDIGLYNDPDNTPYRNNPVGDYPVGVFVYTSGGGSGSGDINDTFTDVNGTLLSGREPTGTSNGNTWSAVNADIQGNELRITSSDSGGTIEYGFSDQQVVCEFNAGGANNKTSIGARLTGNQMPPNDDGYTFNFRPGNDDLRLFRWVGGVSTQLSTSVSFTISNTTTYTLRMTVETVAGNPVIKCYVDDVIKFNYTDTDAAKITTGTRAGVQSNNLVDAAGRHDDFIVQAIGEGFATFPTTLTLSATAQLVPAAPSTDGTTRSFILFLE